MLSVLRRHRLALAVLLGYAVIAVVLFGRSALADPTHVVVGSGQLPSFAGRDQGTYVWFLAWAHHALAQLQDPFHTSALYAPWGFDLARATSMLGPATVMLPVTATAGPVVAYDILALLAPAGAAWTSFLLCRHLTRSVGPSIVGGALFGFSSYLIAETINHVSLALVALLPVVALLVVRRVEGHDSRRRFVAALALVLGLQLWTATEVFASLVVLGTVALAIAWLLAEPRLRPAIRRAAGDAGLALGGAIALGAPYVVPALTGPDLLTGTSQVDNGADLANFVFPSHATWLHAGPHVRLARNVTEQLAYLGVPLIVILVAFVVTHRRRQSGRLLGAFMAVALLVILGGRLWVAGRPTSVSLPWHLVAGIPLLHHAIPARFVVYLWLAAAVACALWLAQEPRRLRRWALAALALAALVPNETGLPWGTRLDAPPLLARGDLARYVPEGATVLALPFGIAGDSMTWQQEAGFRFRLAGGYPNWALPASYKRFSIIGALRGGPAGRHAAARLRRFIRATGVSVIMLREGMPGDWQRLLGGLHARPVVTGGFAIYRLPSPRHGRGLDQLGARPAMRAGGDRAAGQRG
ncbi:MAG: hypothetical protein JWN32_2745 [Solirubrobacterales bacterium]|nr:hypothetical protein [Solirubrobacterales bacterium]